MKKYLFLLFFTCLMCLVMSSAEAFLSPSKHYETKQPVDKGPFVPKHFRHLKSMEGFSRKALEMHLSLYEGYVKNTNLLLELLDSMRQNEYFSVQYSELKRRLMWEYDGMRLHEEYFSNLGGSGIPPESDHPLIEAIERHFDSYESWKEDFIATGMMRGIGWVVLYQDPITNRLVNAWIGEHDLGHLAGGKILLIMDVWEHAYLVDYGTDRRQYIDAFFRNIDWNIVEQRFAHESRYTKPLYSRD